MLLPGAAVFVAFVMFFPGSIFAMGRKRTAGARELGLSAAEMAVLRRLDTPQKIQAYLHRLKQNWEVDGDTCRTVRGTLRAGNAHCIEGAMLAACALWVHGEPPLLLDMRAVRDFDHVVALFRRRGLWGAISKTNGVFLRWRDPVYRTLRELAMSYFHEYTNKREHKTLREYSVPYDLRAVDPRVWVSGDDDAWFVAEELDRIRHFKLVNGHELRAVTRRDPLERRASVLMQYPKPRALVEKLARLKSKRGK
jgi:hypothetical protein